MGRLAADSSSSSSASSFRELDEVFLQNQTRIWLGEVLSTRLDEDVHISDLLQDGEILFEISEVVWNLLLTKCMELKHLKLKRGPFSSDNCSGRYRPYSNVDSFIKICKILGMSGIDLFSPSDVVEKRDIRKVCICIRALSKKARSKQLSVPDFDLVMCSAAMPTDMVGGIRRSLESSQCTTSSSFSLYKGSRRKLKQENVQAPSDREFASSSEESDEAESRYMGEYSFSSTSKFDDDDNVDDGVSSEQEELPEVYSAIVDSSRINVGERSYISDYLAFSGLMVHASDCSRSVIDGANNMFDFFLNVDSSSDNKSCRKKYFDDECMEVSSTTSMSSVVGRMLNFEFCDASNADEFSSTNVRHGTEKNFRDTYILSRINKPETFEAPLSEHEITPTTSSVSAKDFLPSPEKCQSVIESLEGELRGALNTENEFLGENSEDFVIDNNQEIPLYESSVKADTCETISENHSCMAVKYTKRDQEDVNMINAEYEIGSSIATNENQEERKQSLANPVENIEDEKMDTSQTLSSEKLARRQLLKGVVKGTAIAGVLFLLLHIRKNNGTNNGNQTKRNSGVPVRWLRNRSFHR